MRENPEWRRRDRCVMDAYALKDNLVELRFQMVRRSRIPLSMTDDLWKYIHDALNLTHPLTVYRDQVPREIED
jgi:hypothetical protein